MRTHLLLASQPLIVLLLAACQETSTDPPAGDAPARAAGHLTTSQTNVGAAHGAQVTHFVANDQVGEGSWRSEPDAQGFIRLGGVSVFTSGSGSNVQLIINYNVRKCTPTESICIVDESGIGPIPVDDLTVVGKHGLRLTTNTSTNSEPDFIRSSGAGGQISMTWKADMEGFESRFKGQFETRFGDFRERGIGTFDESHATVAGSAMGLSIPASAQNGRIIFAHNMTIDIIH